MSLVANKFKDFFHKYANGEQFFCYARFCLPIILHCCSICYMDLLYLMPKAIPPDYSSILFVISTSELLLRLNKLHVEDVDLPHPWVDIYVILFLTCLYCDLALRLIWIPMEYIIYFLCLHGANTAVLKIIAPFVPTYWYSTLTKCFNLAETETGCIFAKNVVATIIFLIVFSQSKLFQIFIKILKCLYIISLILMNEMRTKLITVMPT